MVVAGEALLGHLGAHLQAVVAVKAVALDDRGVEFSRRKDVLKGARDRRGSGARGTGDRDDGVLDRHGEPP
jgi:hypothetical protein